MKKLFLILILIAPLISYSQDESDKLDFNEFKLANVSSPAFVLINESPSEIYVPENLKSLTIHVLNSLNNFDDLSEGLSIELSPYYFLTKKSKDRTFFKYIGIKDLGGGKYKQNVFSGVNTTTLSFAYANKEFENIAEGERKVFSFGFRTKLLRFYNEKRVDTYYKKVAKALSLINYPNSLKLKLAAEADPTKKTKLINEFFDSKEGKEHLKKLGAYEKLVKPVFQLDYALGYSSLYRDNNTDSEKLTRFGSWMTAELSLPLNKDSEENKTNNYLNIFAISRYIEDGFNLNSNTLFYRDFGGKLEFEFDKFSLGYEYIGRNGSVDSERSVGTIKYVINKNVSLNGGFGKDFEVTDNLVTLFGINWGLSTGSD